MARLLKRASGALNLYAADGALKPEKLITRNTNADQAWFIQLSIQKCFCPLPRDSNNKCIQVLFFKYNCNLNISKPIRSLPDRSQASLNIAQIDLLSSNKRS